MGAENENLSDHEEGARRALEWLGRSEDGVELAQIIGQMPTKLGDVEIAFIIAIGRAALAGHKAAPQTEAEATARPAMLPTPAAADRGLSQAEFWRRHDEHKRRKRYEELWRANSRAFMEQSHAFAPGNQLPRDGDWRGV